MSEWPATDWPSDRAQYLMRKIAEGATVALYDDELARLDAREAAFLRRAAQKRGYEAWLDRDRDCVVLLPPSNPIAHN